MTIKDELVALKADEPLFHPKDAVAWARKNTRSALHKSLEWDDSVAGEKWRIHQVRQLVAIHIVNDEGVRQWHALSIDQPDGGYRERGEILEVPSLRECLLTDALRALERVQREYNDVKELVEVWDAIDRAKSKAKSSPSPKQRQPRRRGHEDRPSAG